jgi:hypothetical protein
MDNYSSHIDLRGLVTFANIHKPVSEEEVNNAITVNNVLHYMLRFSFSRKLSENHNWVQLILSLPPFLSHFIDKSPQDMITMKNILKAISKLIGVKVFRINRKVEELLSLEAVITMMFMKSKFCRNFNFSMDQFLLRYPEFNSASISQAERITLLEFCNCTRVVQCLIPPHNNKEHILDLVARLTEGYSVRRVTGSGMTEETARRYEIIHIEGNLRIRPRTVIEKETKTASASESKTDNTDEDNATVAAVEVDTDSSFSSSSDEDDYGTSSSSSSSSDNERKRSRDDDFSPCKKNKVVDVAAEDDARDGLLLLLQNKKST